MSIPFDFSVIPKASVSRTTRVLRQNSRIERDFIFSLTIITLTVYMAVFEHQNQVIFNLTVFDVGPLVVKLKCAFCMQTKTSVLEY